MHHTITAPPSISLEDTALLIIRKDALVNVSCTSGSILASDGKAWLYQGDQLNEVLWADYQKALNSTDKRNWPPYTIHFTVPAMSADQTAWVDVTTVYDMGISEHSRGGNESRLILGFQDGGWCILKIECSMDWD